MIVLIGAAASVVRFGLYDVAGNTPHTQPVYTLLETIKHLDTPRCSC